MIRLILLALLASTPDAPTYCDGYYQGYSAAYCAGHTPDCLKTAPPVACTGTTGTYQDGYARGYSAGALVHPPHTLAR